MSITVNIFRNFCEDRRISMEVYADSLSQALQVYFPKRCRVREYRPRVSSWLGDGIWPMRLSRFGIYPWWARRQQGQINHILDHGYGHLLYVLDRARTVVTVHDLIPLARWCGGIRGLSPGRKPWLNLLSFYALRRAAHLVADSNNTRQDLIQFCRCSPEQITVVYPGVDSIFRPYNPAEKSLVRQELGLREDGTCHVLIIGSQIYKNQTGAIAAFARLRQMFRKPLRLLKIGLPNAEWTQGVHQFGLNGTTRCLEVIQRDKLPDVYNSVDCLLFPSLYEGFGWPPLEAMACGTPAVTSNAASLPEVVGDAALTIDPQDFDGLGQALYKVLTDQTVRQTLIERGLKRAGQFTWERTAKETLAVYERIARLDQKVEE